MRRSSTQSIDVGISREIKSNFDSIKIVADNIGLIAAGANREYVVSSLPEVAQIGDVAINVCDNSIYEYTDSGWEFIGSGNSDNDSIIQVSTLPSTAVEGQIVLNTTDNKFYRYTNGQWIEIAVTQGVAQELADGSITTAKFASNLTPVELVDALPTTGNFNGRIVFLKTDFKLYRHNGTSWTAAVPTQDLTGTITATQIADNSISTPKLQAGSVTSNIIGANQVIAGKIATNAITAGTIAAGAVSFNEIASGAIRSNHIYSNTIQTQHLTAGAVTADKILAGTITADKIATGTITADRIVSDSLTKIALGDNTNTYVATEGIPYPLNDNFELVVKPHEKVTYLITVKTLNFTPADIGKGLYHNFHIFNQTYRIYGYACHSDTIAIYYYNNTDSEINFGMYSATYWVEKNGTWNDPSQVLYTMFNTIGFYYVK